MEPHGLSLSGVGVEASRGRLSRLGDEGLARLIRRGHEWAFAVVYERYHQPLYRYCRSILRHEADAQDAVQASFAAAYVALREGRRDAPMRPWLFRIAHNQSISMLRLRRPGTEIPEDLPARGVDVEARAEERERLAGLVADLLELPERQRAALIMRELSGLSHTEIALALDTSVASAKQTIFEARRALAEFRAGRAMSCDEVCLTVSNGDRRALRSRKVRAHLRECRGCADFADAIPGRSADLRALTPVLGPGAAAALLARAFTCSGSSGGGSGSAAAGLGTKAALTVTGSKLTAGVIAVVATVATASALHLSHHSAHSGARYASAGQAVAAHGVQSSVHGGHPGVAQAVQADQAAGGARRIDLRPGELRAAMAGSSPGSAHPRRRTSAAGSRHAARHAQRAGSGATEHGAGASAGSSGALRGRRSHGASSHASAIGRQRTRAPSAGQSHGHGAGRHGSARSPHARGSATPGTPHRSTAASGGSTQPPGGSLVAPGHPSIPAPATPTAQLSHGRQPSIPGATNHSHTS